MKFMRANSAMWLFATACSAAVAFGAGQSATQPAAMTDTRGEQIINQSCTGCHEVRNIETQALDKNAWTKLVNTMVEKGATIKAEDLPGFVEYLTRKHGPLPDGAGKKIMLNICTQCHDLDRIRARPQDRDEWDTLLQSMLNEGAPLSDDDYPVILNYLARNFAPKP
jgi:cytochrome c5